MKLKLIAGALVITGCPWPAAMFRVRLESTDGAVTVKQRTPPPPGLLMNFSEREGEKVSAWMREQRGLI